jgi:multiple antibiotic resistance protein
VFITSIMIKHYVSLIAITNPLSGLAIFLGLTASYSKKEVRKTALTTFIAIFIILMTMTWIGLPLLAVFGITPSVFAIAGGIVIVYIGFSMLQGNISSTAHSPEEHDAASKKDSIAIIPLAIPMIAGPGAMVQTVLIANEMPTVMDKVSLSITCFVVSLTIFLVLRFSDPIHRILGVSGLKVLTRIMGLIIIAIAISMMVDGIRHVFPGLV